MSELNKLRSLYKAGVALRQTPVVDDDFPEMLSNFDTALALVGSEGDCKKDKTINELCLDQFDWVERMNWHNKTVLEALALIASEVGEAVNECRGESPSDSFGEELADICLRTFDLAQWQKIDLGSEIAKKMAINEARGTRGRKI